MSKIDTHKLVTDSIITILESGTTPWQKSWAGGKGFELPIRHNGIPYQGINTIVLWIAMQNNGFTSNRFMTFKQAVIYKGMVRKGSKASYIVKPTPFKVEDKNGIEKTIPFFTTAAVFNVDQIDGLPERFYPIATPASDTGTKTIAEMESFYNAIGADIRKLDTAQACYYPSMDFIQMPLVAQFDNADSYYGVLAHELGHWTGHASRLNRKDMESRKGYAFEELVAELSSCFTVAAIGGKPDFANSASYIASWLKALENDKKFIFDAATAAQKASDYLLNAAGYKKEIADSDTE